MDEATPKVSVVVLNYNGREWLPRCVESLRAQTIADQIEVIVADNASTDGSDVLAEKLLADWPQGRVVRTGTNEGFGAGTNVAVRQCRGEWLFFLNPDVWLEPDCLEQLYKGATQAGAGAAGSLVLEYEDDTIQNQGGVAFDIFGCPVSAREGDVPTTIFAACGFFFIRRAVFDLIGGYDDCYFLYGEEVDLSWRVWLAGEKIVYLPKARIHHRGAALENPAGGTRMVELRTSESKRFYANRNHLLTLAKVSQHVLWVVFLNACLLVLVEGLVGLLWVRRWSFFRRSVLDALKDVWRLRHHIREERARIRAFRQRSDWWMLRFLTLRLNRWHELRRMLKLGLPIVERR